MLFKELDTQTQAEIKEYFQNKDYMVIAVPRYEPIRVYTLRATNTVKTAQNIHNLDKDKAKVLGEALICALMLTSLLKHATDQKVLFKVEHADGVVVAEADAKGRVRGFIEGDIPRYPDGTLMVVKELRLGVPYTSIVPLVSTNLKEALNYYFYQSEQLETYTDMAVLFDEGGRVSFAGGYMVQVMGGATQEAKELISSRAAFLPPMEELVNKRPEDISVELLKGMEPRILGLKEIEYYCPCNEEIAKASLLLLSEEELSEILKEGPAEVVCKFCGKVYRFSQI